MAIPDVLGILLMQAVKEHQLGGAFLMLGRQRFVGSRRGRSAEAFAATIQKYLPGTTEADLHNPDNQYSETFISRLGFSSVDSLDFSDFEDASIIHDLTQPVSEDLMERFDVIYDGGTCEHVFELPTAYRNIDKMLRPGGVLIGHSPCNNWINHGFYQISPEMVYGFWEKAMGYDVLDVLLQPTLPAFVNKTARTSNPNQTGVRPRIQGDLPQNSPIIMHYVVRKPLEGGKGGQAYQTDYVNKWDHGQTR
ncbi:class I SAM-dependent methyltransferase [Pseudorhodobacter turbinis]|uniref:Class I SAM-dependent methyltransferase n=1 Tax=Pseudorhodobacter turbinis TaxID=2500533 RepID=A0A4P8EGS2_9RHOB|nr:class I SAM-dependent methyltransferase [Pseudorhodobacter turbinis]QCO56057.1 class I SAM-dependent methyltransferase [Pseudorhodobacter turbinis]